MDPSSYYHAPLVVLVISSCPRLTSCHYHLLSSYPLILTVSLYSLYAPSSTFTYTAPPSLPPYTTAPRHRATTRRPSPAQPLRHDSQPLLFSRCLYSVSPVPPNNGLCHSCLMAAPVGCCRTVWTFGSRTCSLAHNFLPPFHTPYSIVMQYNAGRLCACIA
ncbi:hypothetical protein M422DRAFT_239614 [Sphaerobolus stellatus SS14]|nr:hypothetical protein M422DRAFT_239614 [Sphaerobolus stellatus SS14]